jgi:predicted AAA+ superfamily ATPase
MEILLEEYYKTDLHAGHFVERKLQLDEEKSYQINGISGSGKTALLKHHLLGMKKSAYLYIDCRDIRIDIPEMNEMLTRFCNQRDIGCVALDNYDPRFTLPNIPRLLVSCETRYGIEGLEAVQLFPLDYEEFLAYEHKFDSTALNHFLQLGGFPALHRVTADERIRYIQEELQHALDDIEFGLMLLAARMASQKVSAFMLYERLKAERKISKDMLYKKLEALTAKGYLHQVEKYGHSRAAKKLYLCDIAVKNALTTQKHFGRLFENLVCLEMLKRGYEIFYDEGIDFYLPRQHRVVLCIPFGNEEMLFKKIESIEGFIITHGITRVEVVTMSSESSLRHPFVTVEMLPLATWALVEGE